MLVDLKCCRKMMNVEDLEKYQTMREKKNVMLEHLKLLLRIVVKIDVKVKIIIVRK